VSSALEVVCPHSCIKHIVNYALCERAGEEIRLCAALSKFLSEMYGFCGSFDNGVTGWHYTEIIDE